MTNRHVFGDFSEERGRKVSSGKPEVLKMCVEVVKVRKLTAGYKVTQMKKR